MTQVENEPQNTKTQKANVLQNKLGILKKSISISGEEFKRQSEQQELDMEKRLEDIRGLISELDVKIQQQTQHRALTLAQFQQRADDEVAAVKKEQDETIRELSEALEASRMRQTTKIKELGERIAAERTGMEEELTSFYQMSKERIEGLIAQVEANGKNYAIIYDYQRDFNEAFMIAAKKLQLEHAARLSLVTEFQRGIEDNFAQKRRALHDQGRHIEHLFADLDEKIASNIRERAEAYSAITDSMDEILTLVNESVAASKRSLGIQ